MPPSDAGATRIQLCGRLKADVEGRHVTPALRGRQGRVLLAYLVLNRGRPVSRDELISAIWPDSPPVDPAAALRTQLSRLRSALGPSALAGRDAVELHLPENTWIDIEVAERSILVAGSAIRAADWKDAWTHAHIALSIAGRPFLAGFDAPWVEEVRRELEELHLRSREIIARAGIGLGGSELAGAERAARAMIRAAPFRESGYLHLMRALVASGNTAEALRAYDELRNLLAEELGSAPGAEIQALHRRLLGGGRDARTRESDGVGAGGAGQYLPQMPPVAEDGGEPRADNASPGREERPSELPLPNWLVPRRRSPLVGRVTELEHLDELWQETRGEGVRQIAFIGGDPGVGKTRLATEFAQRVHDQGGGVLYGRADEEATFTYQPFVEALRHWVINAPASDLERDLGPNAGALAALVPEVTIRVPDATPLGPEGARERLFEAVTGSLAAIAAARPTLLVIDDIHWADPGSLLMLRHIARSPHRTALMIVATYRETEPSDALAEMLADLGREGLFERHHLAGLSRAEVVQLVASIRGSGPEPALARAIQEETGGNPFLVEALVNHIAAHASGPRPSSQRAAIYAAGVPDLVREAIGHRVGELGPSAAQVLEVASVIGREFDSELLIEVSEMPSEEMIGALEAVVSAGLLADVPGTLDRYAFSQALFRQTVYAGVPRARRATLHRQLAEVLERSHRRDPRHVSALARHFAGAGPSAAQKALEYGVRAGAGALGALAFEDAIEHYADSLVALDASGSKDEKVRCELLLALGEAQWRAGWVESARETFSGAARIARSLDDSDALARAALGSCGFGFEVVGARCADAAELLRSALGAGPAEGSLRARLTSRLAEVESAAGDPRRASALSAEALEMAESVGDPDTLARALIARFSAGTAPADLGARAEISQRLAELVPRLRDRDVRNGAAVLRVLAALAAGEFGELDLAIADHSRIAERMKQPVGLLHSRAFMLMQALMGGQFAEAERLTTEMLELGAAVQSDEGVEYSGYELVALRWEQGRIGETEELVRDLIERLSPAVWYSFLALLLAEERRGPEAGEALDAAIAASAGDRDRLPALAISGMAIDALDDAERAAGLYPELLPDAGRIVVGGVAAVYLGPASHHLGVLAALADRPEEAVSHLSEAVAIGERAGALPWLARSRFELARALARRRADGDAERAGVLLGDASRTAEQLGMESLLRRMGPGESRSAPAPRAS